MTQHIINEFLGVPIGAWRALSPTHEFDGTPTAPHLMDCELVDEMKDGDTVLSVFKDDDGSHWSVLYLDDGDINTMLNGYHRPLRCAADYQPPKEFA